MTRWLAMALMLGCGASADDGCEQSPYELARDRYRCTAEEELQTLRCGEWVTVAICYSSYGTPSCTPGPSPGCH